MKKPGSGLHARQGSLGARLTAGVVGLILGGCVIQQGDPGLLLPLYSYEMFYGNVEIQHSSARGWYCAPNSQVFTRVGKPFVLRLAAHVEGAEYPNAFHCESCSLLSGRLPPGLWLAQSEANRGTIEGVPTTPGTYAFTVKLGGVAYSHIFIGDFKVPDRIVVTQK
jgi:hypothetical protein